MRISGRYPALLQNVVGPERYITPPLVVQGGVLFRVDHLARFFPALGCLPLSVNLYTASSGADDIFVYLQLIVLHGDPGRIQEDQTRSLFASALEPRTNRENAWHSAQSSKTNKLF